MIHLACTKEAVLDAGVWISARTKHRLRGCQLLAAFKRWTLFDWSWGT